LSSGVGALILRCSVVAVGLDGGWVMTAGRAARRALAAGRAAGVVSAAEVLDGHVGLDIECLDRIYLNGYVPGLQVGGQVVTFLTEHLGQPIPSPALFTGPTPRFGERAFVVSRWVDVAR
jgi:hypothetical protein